MHVRPARPCAADVPDYPFLCPKNRPELSIGPRQNSKGPLDAILLTCSYSLFRRLLHPVCHTGNLMQPLLLIISTAAL